MTTAVKTGLGIAGVLLVILVLWLVFRNNSGNWKAYPDTDAYGNDMEVKPSGTLDADKAYAKKIGAVAFLRWPAKGQTFFKSAGEPRSTLQGATLYVSE